MASLARRLLGDCRCVLSGASLLGAYGSPGRRSGRWTHHSQSKQTALRPRTLSSSISSGIIRPARATEAAGQPQQQRIKAAEAGFSTKAAGGGKKGKKDDAGGGGGGEGGAPVGDISKVSPVNIYKGTFVVGGSVGRVITEGATACGRWVLSQKLLIQRPPCPSL